jgi:hypothetical protein
MAVLSKLGAVESSWDFSALHAELGVICPPVARGETMGETLRESCCCFSFVSLCVYINPISSFWSFQRSKRTVD